MEQTTIPRIGMLATVRNRRGVISGVKPFDASNGRLHLVDIEYNDGTTPLEESLLWELEPNARLLPPGALPDPTTSPPMQYDDFDALIRACRWSARLPYIDPDGDGPMDRLPVSSPFHGAVQAEDYQLIPLLKAIQMPRVSLLIADDVGLGKTIEAGLILKELMLRRLVRRVLILTPAALRDQWQEELWEKFSLNFDIVDRDSTVKLRRQIGMDANPWRSFSSVITSYHYLKQPDVLAQFLAASTTEHGTGRLPWDLIIVDEAHNLSPSPFGEESDLTKMLRQVAPQCEHRLFLTATPHNGHTRSFTGLLELLDPVRFSQTFELSPAERARVQDVLVRRLKREINERSNPKKFADRLPPEALVLNFSQQEKALSAAFSSFRERVRALISEDGKMRRRAGNFAIEILGKRLLSCPTAFADSWYRCRTGMLEEETASEAEVLAARRSVEDDIADDNEVDSRTRVASTTVGSWLQPMAAELESEAQALDCALENLNLTNNGSLRDMDPRQDCRYKSLLNLIKKRLMDDDGWRDDERLIIFTEYKTTLDYLVRRLRSDLQDDHRILTLFGGMDKHQRKAVKYAFNDPEHDVRILVGTDAASEGLNLQKSARYLLHYDIPWNPSRLEQRNGRLDRHGQSRDVTIWHFASDDDQDLKFQSLIVRKVDSIREDLGATGAVFDELTHQKLIDGISLTDLEQDIDVKVEAARTAIDIPRDDQFETNLESGAGEAAIDLKVIAQELDLSAKTLRSTLDSAMAIRTGRPRVSEPDHHGHCRLMAGYNPSWSEVIDDSIRLPSSRGQLGALPALVFDPNALVKHINGRPIFQPRAGILLMHLSQPLIQRSLTALTRMRFPGSDKVQVSRWTVSKGNIPDGMDALVHLTIEELGVNELRETFHHWVRTVRLPIRDGELLPPLEHVPPTQLQRNNSQTINGGAAAAADLWIGLGRDPLKWLKDYTQQLISQLDDQLEIDRETALENETKRYRSRQGEVSALIESNTMIRFKRELDDMRESRKQGLLFAQAEQYDALDRNIDNREEELRRRTRQYEEVRAQLAVEREYIIEQVIPKRYAMRGEAQVLPINVEIVFPGDES